MPYTHTFAESNEQGHPNDDDVEKGLEPQLPGVPRVLRVEWTRSLEGDPGKIVRDGLFERRNAPIVHMLLA